MTICPCLDSLDTVSTSKAFRCSFFAMVRLTSCRRRWFLFLHPISFVSGPPVGSNECLSRETDQREDVNMLSNVNNGRDGESGASMGI